MPTHMPTHTWGKSTVTRRSSIMGKAEGWGVEWGVYIRDASGTQPRRELSQGKVVHDKAVRTKDGVSPTWGRAELRMESTHTWHTRTVVPTDLSKTS